MKTLHYTLGSTFVLALVTAAAFTSSVFTPSAFAYQGDPSVKGPNFSPERHAAMTAAFEAKDYSAWKNLMGDRGATRKVNQDNFSRFAEANALARSGNLQGAKALRAELGLGLRNGQGRGQSGKQGLGQGRGQGGGNRVGDATGNGPQNGTGPRSVNGDCAYSN